MPTDDDGRVTAFLEKTEDPPTDQINAGCYVFRREVIESIPEGRPVSVERETFPGLLASGARVSGHVDVAYWRDMGTPMDLVRGSADLVRGVAPSAALPGPTGESLILEGARIDRTARVAGGTTVGRNVTIGKGARVEGSMLFDGAVVGDNARVLHAVVGAGARVEEAPWCPRRWSATGPSSARTASCATACASGRTSSSHRTACGSRRTSERVLRHRVPRTGAPGGVSRSSDVR